MYSIGVVSMIVYDVCGGGSMLKIAVHIYIRGRYTRIHTHTHRHDSLP